MFEVNYCVMVHSSDVGQQQRRDTLLAKQRNEASLLEVFVCR
jgi:hypothetical protein